LFSSSKRFVTNRSKHEEDVRRGRPTALKRAAG
jgi:hypothetical protein